MIAVGAGAVSLRLDMNNGLCNAVEAISRGLQATDSNNPALAAACNNPSHNIGIGTVKFSQYETIPD